MQVLASQYPTLYTRKFRVFYTDFNTGGLLYKYLDLCTTSKCTELIGVKIVITTRFVAAGLTTGNLVINSSVNFASPPITTGRMALENSNVVVTDGVGLCTLGTQGTYSTAAANTFQCAKQLADTTWKVCYIQTGGGSVNALSSGVADIWLTFIKLP